MAKETPEYAYQAVAVLYADIIAYSGGGQTVAFVKGANGKVSLVGVTNAVNLGLLDARHARKSYHPDRLASLLGGVPVIVGKAACQKFLQEHGAECLVASVLSDAPKPYQKQTGGGGRRSVKDFFGS